MKKVLVMSLGMVAVFCILACGCNKTEKINAAATNAQCDTSSCASACPMTAKAACCGQCGGDAKAKPAAAGDAKSCCPSKATVKPAATSSKDKANCNPSDCGTKAAVKPAATSSKDKANCDPSDCGTWEKGSGLGCPFSGK